MAADGIMDFLCVFVKNTVFTTSRLYELSRVLAEAMEADLSQITEIVSGVPVKADESRDGSMNIKRALFSEEEKAEIASAQRGKYPAHVHKRFMVLKMKALGGMNSDEIGKIVGIHATSVNRIISRYQQEGIQVIKTREIHQAFEQAAGHPMTRNAIYYTLHKYKWWYRNDQNHEKGAAKASGDVQGQSWVRENL